MILISLTLHNFMSYAEATLDLTQVPIVCLTGDNGAGKTALLDALTWTLWETGRSNSDDLIRLGEKEMWTDLTFAHEDECYRVRRSRQKLSVKAGARLTSRGTLELQIFNRNKQRLPEAIAAGGKNMPAFAKNSDVTPGSGSWRSLTGANVRQTQKQISDLLRMDFDTFVNSAYLRQGKADEFTTRPPGERKQVLSEILALSYFDKLQEKAKERVRQLKADAAVVSSCLTDLPSIQEALTRGNDSRDILLAKYSECEEQLTALEEKAAAVNDCLADARLAKEKLQFGDEHAVALKVDIEALTAQHVALTSQLEKVSQLLSKAPEIEKAAAHFESLKSQVEHFDKNAFEVQELVATRMTHQHQLATMRAKLEVELSSVTAKCLELDEKIQKLSKETHEKDKITQAYLDYKRSVACESDLAARQESFARLTNRANELAFHITESKIRLEADLHQKEQALVDYQTVLNSQENLLVQKAELENETIILEKLETEFQLIEENGIKLKSLIEGKQHKIENWRQQQRDKQTKIEELHAHSDSSICPLCSAPIVDRAKVVERYVDEIDQMDYDITAELSEIATLELERNELRKRYLEARGRLEQRQYLDKQIGQLNEKLMALDRARESQEKLHKEVAFLKARLENDNYAQLERESLIAIKAELHKLDFDPIAYANIQTQIRMQRHIEVRYQQMQRDLQDLKKIDETAPYLKEQRRHLQDTLEGETYGAEHRLLLHDLQEKIAGFQYDRKTHTTLKSELSALIPKTELQRELKVAEAEKPKLDESEKFCSEQLQLKQEQLSSIERDRHKLAAEADTVAELEQQAENLKPAIKLSREGKEEAGRSLAVIEAEVRNLTNRLAELNQSQSQLQELTRQIDDHSFLAEALGKKGIQAVIIENAIPEIESEANRILSRLTENKMHVAFITQQKNKSGSTTETLELVIGDEVGTRNYEMFSGGEAFKVNFAVRVALSRLLARRSGAKLETLIIDEGFGSQDEQSRERLVRSIQAIQNEFARIIVITHMSDIKEMFPMQIQVSKVHGASQLQVIY